MRKLVAAACGSAAFQLSCCSCLWVCRISNQILGLSGFATRAAMAREVQEVELAGLSVSWLLNPEIKERLMEEGAKGLVVPPEGEKIPICVQSTAVANDMFLKPVMVQMRAARSLKIPSVEALVQELTSLWYKHYESKEKRKAAAAGRPPKLPAEFRLPDAVAAVCHTDAKHLKSLLSMCKKQFQSDRQAREIRLHKALRIDNIIHVGR